MSLLVFETQLLRNVAVILCILKPHGGWKYELLSLFAVKGYVDKTDAAFRKTTSS